MSNKMNQKNLLSHNVSADNLELIIQKTTEKIIREGDKPYVTTKQQLELLTGLTQFDFGRFLLQNQGVNGYWTHYMLTHPWYGRKTGKNNRGESFTELEIFILDKAPLMLATQQRFEIFLAENQKKVANHAKLACIPCGLMGELLYLNYKNMTDIELIGIDYDSDTFIHAQTLAEKQNLSQFVHFIQEDAWQLKFQNEFDLISSNGLTIYESDDAKIEELYRIFYKALKVDGKLVTSTITPPPPDAQCEWNMAKINQKDLLLQKALFMDIISPKFQSYRTTEKTKSQLASIGYRNIEFIYDEAKIFPTVVAYK